MTFESENTEEIQNRIEETAANCIESFYWEWFCSIPGDPSQTPGNFAALFWRPKGSLAGGSRGVEAPERAWMRLGGLCGNTSKGKRSTGNRV